MKDKITQEQYNNLKNRLNLAVRLQKNAIKELQQICQEIAEISNKLDNSEIVDE